MPITLDFPHLVRDGERDRPRRRSARSRCTGRARGHAGAGSPAPRGTPRRRGARRPPVARSDRAPGLHGALDVRVGSPIARRRTSSGGTSARRLLDRDTRLADPVPQPRDVPGGGPPPWMALGHDCRWSMAGEAFIRTLTSVVQDRACLQRRAPTQSHGRYTRPMPRLDPHRCGEATRNLRSRASPAGRRRPRIGSDVRLASNGSSSSCRRTASARRRAAC